MEPRNQEFSRRKSQANGTDKNTSRNRIKNTKEGNKNRLNNPHQGGQRTPKLILDSNIIIKLVMNEPGSKRARATITNLLKKGYTLYTVDIALAGGLNAIWKHTNIHKDLRPEETNPTIDDLTKIYDGLGILTTRELKEATTEIALTQNITIYDSLYVAATQKLNGTLYTADQKLHNTANKIINSRLLKPKP
ncbi:MAG: type II toxin-antitoxin system VapC family toxin [Candidatus Bathyarchaeia archaeon]|jgi:predicted nucleic acid-binding protein